MSPADEKAGSGFVNVRGPLSEHASRVVCDQVRAGLSQGLPGVTCRVGGPIDLSVVDLLARVQLLTRRQDAWLEIAAAGEELPDLLALMAFTGLGEVVGAGSPGHRTTRYRAEPRTTPADKRLEARRQTEAGEKCGVEKVVDVDDLPR